MYRKQLRMARGEGDSALTSHFVERVVKLPMVHVAWDYATHTYSHIKESNKLVNFTLTNAERTATFMVGQAKPVVLKFERQIQAVDDLACKGLVTLVEKVPFIKKPAEEIIDETRKMYTDTLNSRLEGIKKYGNDTVKSATDFGLRRANAIFGPKLVQTVLSSVDGVLVVTQNYIDQILPPTKEETQSNGIKEENEKQSSLVRLTRISRTVRRRAYKAFVLKVELIQELSFDLLLTHPLRLIEFTKTHLDAAVEYANKLWIAIRHQEVEQAENSEKNHIEQQLLFLARLVSKQVASTYSSFTLTTSDTNSQEPNQVPATVVAVRDGAMWVLGMLRLIPSLLPMYIYGLLSWIEQKRNQKDETIKDDEKVEVVKTNGVKKESNHSNDGPHSNNIHATEETNGHNSDDSIPEEDED
jgi:hypothetical protein